MPRQRHWVNYGKEGETVFVTTTCLDFAHLFNTRPLQQKMCLSLITDAERAAAMLHSFVVMSNHVHVLVTLPLQLDVTQFVGRVKANSARRLIALLTADQLNQLSVQSGLNRRCFWQRSFRSVVALTRFAFEQKIIYTHSNPIRAGLVAEAEDYPWSSAWAYREGLADENFTLDKRRLIEAYKKMSLNPDFMSGRRHQQLIGVYKD